MSGIPVVVVPKGGLPVRSVDGRAPVMTIADNGMGIPITYSNNGAPFVVRGGGAAWTPEQLFNGEQPGFWAGSPDPALGRMWQDSAGVTPVTAAGQPVGLLFDAVSGGDRGPETSSSGWGGNFVQASSGGGFDGSKPSPGGTEWAYTTNTFSAKNGERYEVTVDVTSTTLPNFNILLSQMTNSRSTPALVTGAGIKKVYVRANTTQAVSISVNTTSVGLITVESASVCEVLAIAAFQDTALSRPTLRQSGSVWYLSNDGGDSLPVTLPAGLYGRAWVDAAGLVTVDTVTDPTNALIPTAVNSTQADVILRQGTFTADEEASIRSYWAERYAA